MQNEVLQLANLTAFPEFRESLFFRVRLKDPAIMKFWFIKKYTAFLKQNSSFKNADMEIWTVDLH